MKTTPFRLPAVAIIVIVTAAGCAASPTPKNESPAIVAQRATEALRDQPLARDITMTLPPDWKRPSPAVAVSGKLEARIDFMVGISPKTITLEIRQFCRILSVQDWHCEDGLIASDGTEGMFTYARPRRRGMIAIRHYADGTAVILRGEWPTASDKRATRDFTAIFRSTSPK